MPVLEGVPVQEKDDRRVPDANRFELIGSLDDDQEYFRIGRGRDFEYISPCDAELYTFANDLKSKYGNNSGQLSVTITRMSWIFSTLFMT